MNTSLDLLRQPDRSRLLAVIVILSTMLALAACSSSSDDDNAAREPAPVTDASDTEPPAAPTTETTTPTSGTTATVVSTVTTVGPTTVTTTKPTKSVPPGACRTVPPIPSDATYVSYHSADPDGDGATDEIAFYQTVEGRWHLRAELTSGSTIDGVIGETGSVIIGQPFVGAHDLDRDGDDELAARAGSGAAADLVAFWELRGCELAAITLDGKPAVFPIGTSVAAATGLSCSDGYADHLYFTDLTSHDGLVYEGRIAAFDLVNGRLVDRGGEGASYPIENLGTSVGLHCGSLALT